MIKGTIQISRKVMESTINARDNFMSMLGKKLYPYFTPYTKCKFQIKTEYEITKLYIYMPLVYIYIYIV